MDQISKASFLCAKGCQSAVFLTGRRVSSWRTVKQSLHLYGCTFWGRLAHQKKKRVEKRNFALLICFISHTANNQQPPPSPKRSHVSKYRNRHSLSLSHFTARLLSRSLISGLPGVYRARHLLSGGNNCYERALWAAER